MSKNTAKYILMLLGVLIFLAFYFLVYMDYTSKADALSSEISELKTRLDTLGGYELNQTRYLDAIAQDKTEISDMLGRYYSSERPEDFIILATDLEDNVGLSAIGLAFDGPAEIYTLAGVIDGKNDQEPVAPLELACHVISSTISTTLDYGQMKQALDFITAQKDVTKLNNLSITYDSSTGLISGEFTLDKYFITGRDIPDHETNIPFTDLGKSVLIGG